MRHSTTTTASTTSTGKPASCMHGHRLAVRLEAEQMAEDFGHRVAADIGVLEHEGVARIVAQRVRCAKSACGRCMREARFSSLPMRSSISAMRSCISDRAPACRRCSRPSCGSMRLQAPIRSAILVLRCRWPFASGMSSARISTSSGDAGAAAEQHVDDFLEIEQPERQLQIARR